jgi:hypothetical protein
LTKPAGRRVVKAVGRVPCSSVAVEPLTSLTRLAGALPT